MGMLVRGKWTTKWYEPDDQGRFVRESTSFRHRVTRDGSSGFPAAPGRYHLYVSYACPWAHRTLIFRRLKKLEDIISVSVVDYHMTDEGWHFSDREGATEDAIGGHRYLREVYTAADPEYTGRVTVPVLWDRERKTIVNNESREIIAMLNREFDDYGDATVDFFPRGYEERVERALDAIYQPINNGVYRCGFATTQAAYDEAFDELFAALDHWDQVLGEQRYLCGDMLTAADWCMFTTLVRFDCVYYVHFKTNRRHIWDYPNLGPYLRELYQVPGVKETVNFDHIKKHYFQSHPSLNPQGIVPRGPEMNLELPHDRDQR